MPSNTLTVVTSSCPENPLYTVPYFVGGFGSERLSRNYPVERIEDLIVAIRTVSGKNDEQVSVEEQNI